jgi:hypothetical protein
MPNHGRIITTGSEFGDRSMRGCLVDNSGDRASGYAHFDARHEAKPVSDRTQAGQGSQTENDLRRE